MWTSENTVTPTELADMIWGPGERDSRGAGPRQIRKVARQLFGAEAPGQGGRWHLTPAQADAIREQIADHPQP
jgi:hypothetical protein